jgi:integrase
VLSLAEVQALLARMERRPGLIASLLYGTGLRLMECLRLRVHDVDFARNRRRTCSSRRGFCGAAPSRVTTPPCPISTMPSPSDEICTDRLPDASRGEVRGSASYAVGFVLDRPARRDEYPVHIASLGRY